LPQRQSRRQACRKGLRAARTVFDDCAPAVTHRASRPKSPPLVVIKNLRCACVRLIKGRNDSLACDQQCIAGESSGDRAVKISFRQRILQSRGTSQTLELALFGIYVDSIRKRGKAISSPSRSRDIYNWTLGATSDNSKYS